MRRFPPLVAILLIGACSQTGPGEDAGNAVEQPTPLERHLSAGAREQLEQAGENEAQPAARAPSPAGAAKACMAQDGKPIDANRLHGLGTEPFWAVDVVGRCVTYSHPDDQEGTRVWTKFSGTMESGTWTGALRGRDFTMKTRPERGCSDGMSDKRYPIAVTLTVDGELRHGCAEPR